MTDPASEPHRRCRPNNPDGELAPTSQDISPGRLIELFAEFWSLRLTDYGWRPVTVPGQQTELDELDCGGPYPAPVLTATALN